VTTNGGPVFPKDLVLGRIVKTDEGMRVKLSADLSGLDFVAVLQYKAPT
jgi:hypothetical protein